MTAPNWLGWPNWMVSLSSLAALAMQPGDKGGLDLDNPLALSATLPWV